MAEKTDEAGKTEETGESPKRRAPRKQTAQKRTPSGNRTTREQPHRSGPKAVRVARSAREQLGELLGRESESVIGIRSTEDGWEVDLEVVETRRIPDTTDVLAIYRVQLDGSGDIEGYQRLERYIRGQAEGGVVDG